MRIKKEMYNRIITRLKPILLETSQAGIDMLNWHQLAVGDLIDADGDYNFYSKVRIIKKVEDVSIISGLEPGPGFVVATEYGEDIVIAIQDVDPESYGKYALAESRRFKAALTRLIKEYDNWS
jgi:hypothetical protein